MTIYESIAIMLLFGTFIVGLLSLVVNIVKLLKEDKHKKK